MDARLTSLDDDDEDQDADDENNNDNHNHHRRHHHPPVKQMAFKLLGRDTKGKEIVTAMYD